MKPMLRFLGFCILLSFCSCDQALVNKDLALKSIPEEASTVTAFRLPQLLRKADFENFKKLPVYQELIKEAQKKNAALGKIAEDPSQSGIDLQQNIYAFTQLADNNPEDIFNGLLIPIQEAGAFSSMLAQMDLPAAEEVAGVNYIKTSRKSAIAWNAQLALIGMSNNRNTANLAQRMAALLNAEGTSIAEDKNLQQLLAKEADIVTWASSNALASYKDAQLMIAGLGFDPDALKDNFIQGQLNFEKGAVNAQSKLLLRKTLTQDLDLLFKDEVATDFNAFVPGEQLAMAFSAALDFKGFNQVLSERPQSKGFLNYALKEYGLTIDDIAKALGGDLILAIYHQEKPTDPQGLFITTIDEQKVFEKFLSIGEDYQFLEKQQEGFYKINKAALAKNKRFLPRIFLNLEAGYLMIAHDKIFISAHQDLLAKIKDGGFDNSEQLPKEFRQEIGQNIFTAMMDFEHLKNLQKEMEVFSFEDLKINAKRASSDFNLQLKNQDDNSLKALLWMINEAYEKDRQQLEGVGNSAI